MTHTQQDRERAEEIAERWVIDGSAVREACADDIALALASERERWQAENARLREALRPLAEIGLWRDHYPDASSDSLIDERLPFTADQIRAARSALAHTAAEGE